MRLDLTTLNLVLAIEQTRSMTRGAEREHLALAAASKRISDLETRLGVQLFERRARGVEPTEACRALVRHIRSLHASLHALESEVVEFARGIKGHLRIAANAGAIAEALPPDLAALAAEPGARLAIADPVSGAPYGYAIIEARSYEVCATFTTDTAQSGDVTGWPGEVWSHDVGPQCFERKVKAPGKDD